MSVTEQCEESCRVLPGCWRCGCLCWWSPPVSACQSWWGRALLTTQDQTVAHHESQNENKDPGSQKSIKINRPAFLCWHMCLCICGLNPSTVWYARGKMVKNDILVYRDFVLFYLKYNLGVFYVWGQRDREWRATKSNHWCNLVMWRLKQKINRNRKFRTATKFEH